MPTSNIIEPKQQRSQDTQKKLLTALHDCLEEKYFEHISIQELAQKAGVSVGTYYRRFKNKEALLPLLYLEFGNDLITWTDSVEAQDFANLYEALCFISVETKNFVNSKKSVFRTLHLNARLYPELITVNEMGSRKNEYNRLADVLLRFEDEITLENKQSKANTVIYKMITGLLDKVLYPDLTPAIACDLDADAFAAELPEMFYAYLTRQAKS